MSDDEYVWIDDIASDLGVGVESVRTYHKRATANRRKAERDDDPTAIRPGDLPAPDKVKGRTPMWLRSTYEEWKAQRPGRGAGGGRPW